MVAARVKRMMAATVGRGGCAAGSMKYLAGHSSRLVTVAFGRARVREKPEECRASQLQASSKKD